MEKFAPPASCLGVRIGRGPIAGLGSGDGEGRVVVAGTSASVADGVALVGGHTGARVADLRLGGRVTPA